MNFGANRGVVVEDIGGIGQEAVEGWMTEEALFRIWYLFQSWLTLVREIGLRSSYA